MPNWKLSWNLRRAVARHGWAELTFSSNRPPPLDDGGRMWAPYRLLWGRLVWVDMQGEQFTKPFARGDFGRRIASSNANVRITRMEALEAVDQVTHGIPPSGFVFHISRCGSTLLRHVLGAVPGSLALGEPPVFTAALSGESVEVMRRRLHGGVKALGRAYTGNEKHFFVKFPSPHAGKLDVFEASFPDVPMLYLYRDPCEVFQKVIHGGGCAWLEMKRAPQLAAGFVRIDAASIDRMSVDEYAARVIGTHYEIAASHSARGLKLLNYRNLTRPEYLRRVLEFFGLDLGDEGFERVFALTTKDAKRPKAAFKERPVPELSARQRDLVSKWASEPYERLERLSR